MAHSTPSSPSVLSSSVLSSNFGVLSASDIESHSERASQSDSDFEVVLVQPTSTLAISDSDSGSLVSAPTDSLESSDDEHIMVPNISQSTPNTPRPPSLTPARLLATSRPASVAFARPIVESGHDSDASDREDDSSNASTYESDSDSDSDSGSVLHARARTVTITNDRLEAPLTMGSTTSLGTVHANGSTATIRPAALSRPVRRPTPAGMHTPAITTNTIMGILSSAPLSPPTPSDGGEIPYAPFTAAPTAVSAPRPAPAPRPASVQASSVANPSPPPAKKSSPAKKVVPGAVEPPIPTKKTTRKQWATMNIARMKLGFEPLQHVLRRKNNTAIKAKNKAKNEAEAKTNAKAKAAAKAELKAKADAKTKAKADTRAKASASKAKSAVAPRSTVGASPVTSEDETSRVRASMFSPVNDISVRSESPDEEAYDAAIKQLDEHMSSPPEHPTATYRYLLNRALLLEFRVCTPETLPTSHGAAIAMVKSNVHINVLDYVAKRKEGFNGLRTVMLANAKALRKDVQKRRMPVKVVKSLGLHSLLVLT
ncbi:hypothetical protein BDV93DRAFT_540481 [Ceratobasidium sp. AG-I]|nr:hypothetical protein BDV93DRAFT_540481 [Ceratobasidium sp. AG-I]